MPRLSRLAALALASALLAGCGSSLGPMTGKATTASAIGARAMGMDEIDAVVAKAAAPARDTTIKGTAAVLQYPTDAGQQRALSNLFAVTRPSVMAGIPGDIDEELHEVQIARYLSQVPQVTDPEVNAYLQGVADRLTKAMGEKPFKVYVADTPMVNAFNAGGHALVVFKGLLTVVNDESELAGVMAHEMTHGLKRHALKGWVDNYASQATFSAAAEALQPAEADLDTITAFLLTLPPSQQNDYDFVMGFMKGKIAAPAQAFLGYQYNAQFSSLANGRAMEAEADAGGARMLAAAGYDPNGLWRTFDRMNSRPEGDTRYYNHPALGARVASLKSQIAAEGLKGKDRGRDRLQAIVAKLKAAGTAAAPSEAQALAALPSHLAGAGCLLEVPQSGWQTAFRQAKR